MNKIEKLSKLLKDTKEKKAINKKIHDAVHELTLVEKSKEPLRTDIINYLLSLFNRETTYLEIGVRNPEHNFNHIKANIKYSVDPGLAFKENPVDFKMTSDAFFEKLGNNEVLSKDIKFDVIFVDGLHLADQVDVDIINSFKHLKEDGFLVMHDCNPPSQWHAREVYEYTGSPARNYWNGTTWKAFAKWRTNPEVYSCCIDSDWGVGILSKKHNVGQSTALTNPFYEFHELEKNRVEHLNLIDFKTLKSLIGDLTIED